MDVKMKVPSLTTVTLRSSLVSDRKPLTPFRLVCRKHEFIAPSVGPRPILSQCRSASSSRPNRAGGEGLKGPVRGGGARPRQLKPIDPSGYDASSEGGIYGYAPRFRMTQKLLDDIVQVEKFRGFLLGTRISPQWLKNTQNNAFVAEAHHTTHIEGTALSLAQSEYILSGSELPQANPEDVRELLNYRRAFDLVSKELGRGAPITEMMIREIHRRLVEGVRGDRAVPGEYRAVQNYVANSQTGKIIYEPPAAFEIPRLMNELIQWLRSDRKTNPAIKAGITQFQLVHIHPFLDGNGRTARLLSALILHQEGYDFKQMLAISPYYDKDRSAYYRALQSVREPNMDLTSWIEYFTKGLAIQMQEI